MNRFSGQFDIADRDTTRRRTVGLTGDPIQPAPDRRRHGAPTGSTVTAMTTALAPAAGRCLCQA